MLIKFIYNYPFITVLFFITILTLGLKRLQKLGIISVNTRNLIIVHSLLIPYMFVMINNEEELGCRLVLTCILVWVYRNLYRSIKYDFNGDIEKFRVQYNDLDNVQVRKKVLKIMFIPKKFSNK